MISVAHLAAVPTSCRLTAGGSHGISTVRYHDKDATLPPHTKMSIHCYHANSTVLADTITARHCTVAVDACGLRRMLVDVDGAL
ncbi:hypothetical protein BDR05DRAFT_964800 [Suillus weaverae]|nr:hypothetical protein BDR05DRAFT_964800 [Suillus weaverae]